MLCVCGNHAWAALTRGLVVLVSPEDAGLLDHKWYAATDPRGYVTVRRNVQEQGAAKRRQERLARVIAKPRPFEVVDHRNSDTLDNRRENLRACTCAQNRLNCRPLRGKAVPLKGVRVRQSGRFEALITRHGKQHYLGIFDTAAEAHAVYCKAAHVIHGEFARVA